MGADELREARREARLEAAPFAASIFAASACMAIASRRAEWELFGASDWWIWLLLGVPSAILAATFWVGLHRIGLEHGRRELAIVLLGLLGLGTAVTIGSVIVSLTNWQPTGLQLLASAAAVFFTNVITFALIFWELDNGGPVARALASNRERPDFQFPQDENQELARPAWVPELVDYVYLSTTNSIAFSPTDAMPLTHRAKLFMGIEAAVSALTVLVVAARAINVLGQ